MRTLVVTNDFPPRPGGIQQYVHALASRLPPDEVVVYAPAWKGASGFDAEQAFPIVRHDTSLMLPVPAVLRRARDVATAEGCDRLWFGAAAPLALLAPRLRDIAPRSLASTHGHETGWARLPGARQALRRIGSTSDVVTYVSSYTRELLAPALGRRARLEWLPSGVDTDAFHPDADGAAVRRRLGLGERPVIVCVSRLVARKGQDMLIRALPQVRREIDGAALLVVGGGPDMPRLQRLAVECGVADEVRFTGSVPWPELPAHYAAGDVFAMPCRTRLAGVDVEGLGIVYLEAAATGLPVVAGTSGGAPEAVLDGRTGVVVDPTSLPALTASIVGLLADRDRAAEMGRAGREWVEQEWRWETLTARLRDLLAG